MQISKLIKQSMSPQPCLSTHFPTDVCIEMAMGENGCSTLSAEKCELLKTKSKCNGENLTVNNDKIKLVNVAKYLGDSFNSKGS